jgi:uncharacterized membrane protein YeaQ/YmgE (transglycosylase-associated protein family)
MDWVQTIIVSLLAGIIIGPLARLVLPGRQNISLGMTVLIGAVGAFLGGLIAQWIGVEETSGLDWTMGRWQADEPAPAALQLHRHPQPDRSDAN